MKADDKSISALVLQLCKEIVAADFRPQFQSLLHDLHLSRGDGEGRGMLGYYARQFGGGFVGLLAIDLARAKLNPNVGILPTLTADEREMLVQIQRELDALLDACGSEIARLRPGISEAIYPYHDLPHGPLSIRELRAPHEVKFLPRGGGDRIVSAIRNSAMSRAIQQTPPFVRNSSDPAKLLRNVAHLERSLRSPQTKKDSDTLFTIAHQPPDSQPRQLLVFHAALAGLRSSFRNIGQLVYQACWEDRLPTIDGSNLIALKGPRVSLTERSLWATIQPSACYFYPEPSEIAYFKSPDGGDQYNGLVEVVAVEHQMSQKAGNLCHLTLHLIDDALNASPLFGTLAQA